MKEDLLQYIWQFQYFNLANLSTTEGQTVQIISPGVRNFNAGPDFSQAKIKMGDTVWNGNVELHVNGSDWFHHNHQHDSLYRNVILHVVWKNDKDIKLRCPTLELQNRIPKLLLERYNNLMQSSRFIPCEKHFFSLNHLSWVNWRDRLLDERLTDKAKNFKANLVSLENHWEESFWHSLAGSFGLAVNKHFFEQVARATPVKILARHKHNTLQIEALLFGQAGLLGGSFKDKYALMLQKEYRFLKHKYFLCPPQGQSVFLRMRPANFPTIRLSQLAQLIYKSEHLFSKVLQVQQLLEVFDLLKVEANDYWSYHYIFDEEVPFKRKKLGKQMTQKIVINTIVPCVYTYGLVSGEKSYCSKAMNWLGESGKEVNGIIKKFEALHFPHTNAADSQALLHLKKYYCDKRRCLNCTVGATLLKRNPK